MTALITFALSLLVAPQVLAQDDANLYTSGPIPPQSQWQRMEGGPGVPIEGGRIVPIGTPFMPSFWVRGVTPKVAVGEKYKGFFQLAADPAFLCGPDPGINVWQVEVPLWFSVPCAIDIRVDFEHADMSDPSCPVPGEEICVSGITSYTIPIAAVWTLGVGIPACGCVDITGPYFFSFEIMAVSCTPAPAFLTDATPSLCQSYINPSSTGWVDAQTYFGGLPGDIVVSANAICCDDPVGQWRGSWGEMKGRFVD